MCSIRSRCIGVGKKCSVRSDWSIQEHWGFPLVRSQDVDGFVWKQKQINWADTSMLDRCATWKESSSLIKRVGGSGDETENKQTNKIVSLKKGWWVRCWNCKTGWWWKLMLCCCFEGEEGWIKMSNCRNVGTLRQMVIVVLFLLLFCLQHYHMCLATSSAIFSWLLRSFNCCVSCVCCVRCPELFWYFL